MSREQLEVAVHLNSEGEISRVEFRDGTVVEKPNYNIKERPIKNAELARLSAYDVGIFRSRESGEVFSCCKMPWFCWCYPGFKLKPPGKDGGLIVRIGSGGDIIGVQCPDGTVVTEPAHNLKEKPVENVDILRLSGFDYIEFRQNDGSILHGIHVQNAGDFYAQRIKAKTAA